MTEPNPYESPKVEQPLKAGQIVKRSIGVGVVLLLTPPAMLIAIGICCSASSFTPGWLTILVILFGPFVFLSGMMAWAASYVEEDHRAPSRLKALYAVPRIVAVGVAVGIVCGIPFLAMDGPTVRETVGEEHIYEIIALAFISPIVIAFIVALWRASRAA
jgi:hypothetical protein